MKKNLLGIADDLSDTDLLGRIPVLARKECETCAELVAHLAALEARPSLYLADGYGSLFAYCREGLHLTEDVASNRVAAARFCRRFPGILELLASGALSLSALRVLGPHLTEANHSDVLTRARGRSRREAEILVAELAPRPVVPTSITSLPDPAPMDSAPSSGTQATNPVPQALPVAAPDPAPVVPARRSVLRPLSPGRFEYHFTVGQETHDRVQRLQTLLRREIPSGDVALLFAYMAEVTLAQVERKKLGRGAKPRRAPTRPGADSSDRREPRRPVAAVRAAVAERDSGQCAFVSKGGRRCTETAYLEFDHVKAYARGGGRTVPSMRLLCRRHNQYESELVFGPFQGGKVPTVREHGLPYGLG